MTSVALLLCLLGAASAHPQFFGFNNQRAIPTLTQRVYQSDPSGQFTSSVSQSDGQVFQEQGELHPSPEGYVLVKKGNFEYISPEGLPVKITYTADETGFHPTGNVIPQAPVPVAPTF